MSLTSGLFANISVKLALERWSAAQGLNLNLCKVRGANPGLRSFSQPNAELLLRQDQFALKRSPCWISHHGPRRAVGSEAERDDLAEMSEEIHGLIGLGNHTNGG